MLYSRVAGLLVAGGCLRKKRHVVYPRHAVCADLVATPLHHYTFQAVCVHTLDRSRSVSIRWFDSVASGMHAVGVLLAYLSSPYFWFGVRGVYLGERLVIASWDPSLLVGGVWPATLAPLLGQLGERGCLRLALDHRAYAATPYFLVFEVLDTNHYSAYFLNARSALKLRSS
jgi:hypothetical protein